VERVNNDELAKCPGQSTRFPATDFGYEPHLSTLQKNCPAPAELVLKPRTQVILLKNLSAEEGLVNGARGVVMGFDTRPDDQGSVGPAPRVKIYRGAYGHAARGRARSASTILF
jgi:hypothetical protein